MSVDLPRDVLNQRIAEFRISGPVKHTLVFYGGYLLPEQGDGIQPAPMHNLLLRPGASMAMFEGRTLRRRYRTCAQAWDVLMPFFQYRVAMNSDLDGSSHGRAVRAGGEFLAPERGESPFDSRGKLVVYGFSAGGFNALNLCRRIEAYFCWYDFSLKKLGGHPSQPANRSAPIKVDLLITVDPCRKLANRNPNSQDMAAEADTRTPGAVVLRHVNYYQDRDPDFRGVEMQGADNQPWQANPAGAHDSMPLRTLGDVKTKIRNLFQ